MTKKRHKLNDCEKKAVAALLKSERKRSEISKLFGIDPTVVDKIRSGIDNNPFYIDEKWSDLSPERQEELLNEIEQGKRSVSGVVNGWCVCSTTINKALEQRKTAAEKRIDDDITILYKFIKNAKESMISKYGQATDSVIMTACLNALMGNEKKENLPK